MSLFDSIRKLEADGIDLVEVLGRDDHLRSPDDLQTIVASIDQNEADLYVELLYFLTHRRFGATQARSLWTAILKHKARMATQLGRDVRFRVAALDYLHGKTSLLKGVRLVARPEMDALLSCVAVDEVTGVYNRRHFNETLTSELNRARRYGSSLSLLIVDLDDFKELNDSFGHLEGDSALRQVGRLLRQSTRQADSVCRYGGDEFGIVLPETSASEALTFAERVRRSIGRLTIDPANGRGASGAVASLDAPPITLSASIGGATFPVECEEVEDLLRLADSRCLQAKRDGKDRVVIGPSSGAATSSGLGGPDLGGPDLGGPDFGGPDLGGPDFGGPDLDTTEKRPDSHGIR